MLSFISILLINLSLINKLNGEQVWAMNSSYLSARSYEIFVQKITEINGKDMFRSRALNFTVDDFKDKFECELEKMEWCEANFISNTALIAKTNIQTEILQLCQSLERDVECLLNFLNKCPKIERSSFTILSYIYDKNRNVIETCKRNQYEWIDPHPSIQNVIETSSGICFETKDIEKCDKKFVDFDVSKDRIKNQKECNEFKAYKKCINSIVKKSKCHSKVKATAKTYLQNRVKFAIDCKTGNEIVEIREEERVLVESEMQSEIDAILETPCRRKANPLMHVCTRQHQKRIDKLMIASYSHSEQILPHICCSYSEFTKCVTIITLLKCGKDEALRVSRIIEPLRQISSPIGCDPYEYGSDLCQPVLN